MVMNDPLLFNVHLPSFSWDTAVSKFDLKIQGQSHVQGQTLWLRYGKFHVGPGKFKVKVMAKVKLDGRI